MTSSVSRLDLIWNRSRAPDHPVGRACLLSAFYAFLLANLYLPPPFPSKNSIPIFPISRRESVSLKGRLREGLKDFFFFFFFSRYGRKLWNFIGGGRRKGMSSPCWSVFLRESQELILPPAKKTTVVGQRYVGPSTCLVDRLRSRD